MHLDETTPLWRAARCILRKQGKELFRLRDRVLTTPDPDMIHDLRIASRRLREGLALFVPCYQPDCLYEVDRNIRKITRLLGAMRNTDEAVLFFTELTQELDETCHSDLQTFLSSLRKQRKREKRSLRNGLRKLAGAAFRRRYRDMIRYPVLLSSSEKTPDLFAPVSDFARMSLDSRFITISELLPQVHEEKAAEVHHRMRIAIKHFRYRMEILSFLMGEMYESLHASLKKYQDLLGKMHDLDVFMQIVRDAEFLPETEQGLLTALLVRRKSLFADFSEMLKTSPLEDIQKQARALLPERVK